MPAKELARGAEGVLSLIEFLGMKAVSKNRVQKGYRIKALDERLRTGRTRVEARLLNEAKKAGVLCPVVYSVSGSELIVSFVEGELLRSALERKAPESAKLLKSAGEALARLHSAGIIHGDYTTANVIVCKGKAWIIDFGLGSFSEELEEKAIDVLLMKRSLRASEYEEFLKGYKAYAESAKVLRHLSKVEERGRYVVRKMAE